NNRFEFTGTGDFAGVGNAPPSFNVSTDGNQVAFVGEAGVSMVADILPSWSLKGGYHVFYLDNLATVASNITFFDESTFQPSDVNTDNDALYHGFDVSMEYVW